MNACSAEPRIFENEIVRGTCGRWVPGQARARVPRPSANLAHGNKYTSTLATLSGTSEFSSQLRRKDGSRLLEVGQIGAK